MKKLSDPAARGLMILAGVAAAAGSYFMGLRGVGRRGVPPPPTETVRAVNELQPLRSRWRSLDARLQAAESSPQAADWPSLLKEAADLLGDSAQAQRRLGRDMAGLVPGRDKASGLPRDELAARSYFDMDELGTCILRASEQIRLLHASFETGDSAAAKGHAKSAALYLQVRRYCMEPR